MLKDSGNTLAKARKINLVGGSGGIKEAVGGSDRFDFIKLNVTQRSLFNATLTKLKANVDLDLFNSSGKRMGRSAKPDTQSESILTVLEAGQYFLKVSGTKQASRYCLKLRTPPLPSPVNTAPTLSTNTGASLARGSTVNLNSDLLRATDLEQQFLVYTVTQLPIAGKLKYKGVDVTLGQSFTQGDIDTGSLSYLSLGAIALTNNALYESRPQISGTNVVWSASDGSDNEIYFFNGSTTIQLTDNDINDDPSDISGSNVVWEGVTVHDTEIYFYNGSTTTRLTNNDTYDSNEQISGSNVVWSGYSDYDDEIYFYNGSTTTQLTNNDIYDSSPQISGSNIVWSGMDGSGRIYFYDGSTTIRLPGNSTLQGSPQISGSNVVWVGYDGSDYEIYLYNGNTTTQLTNNDIDDLNPQISGSNVVWSSYGGSNIFADSEVYFYNGSSITQLTNNSPYDAIPQISGGNVVWSSYDGLSYFSDTEIYFYNGSTTIQLTHNALNDFAPQISGSNIVWLSQDDGAYPEVFFLKVYNRDSFGFTVTDGIGGTTSGTFDFTLN
jgi:Cadherin-like